MSKCPSCKSGCKKRITKIGLYKFFFSTRIYTCKTCKAKYFKIPLIKTSIIIKK